VSVNGIDIFLLEAQDDHARGIARS